MNTTEITPVDHQQLLVTMAVKAWQAQVDRATKIFGSYTDEQLMQEIAPGRNTGIYLFGHLIAANEAIIGLYGIGERKYAAYDEPFLKSADKTGHTFPTMDELRAAWEEVHTNLEHIFAGMQSEQWLQRHTAMTDEDLAKDPTRNRLSVLYSRTSHIAYHLGQVALIKK